MSKSILDLLPENERKKAIDRGRKRLERQRTRKGLDVSPEIYMVAEFGYYFGWDGVLAIKRGYIEKLDAYGKTIKEPFTLDEALVLLEGARKVWYSKVIEQSHGNLVAHASTYSKSPGTSFNNGMKPFTDKAEVID